MIKSKQTIVFMLVFLICNAVLLISFKPTFHMDVVSKGANSDLNVYYDNLTKGYPFDDTHMTSTITLLKDKTQKLSFKIPNNSLGKLRIDFGSNPGVFEISNLSVRKSLFYETSISSDEIVQVFSNNNDIEGFSAQGKFVSVKTSGKDGYISTLNFLDKGSTNIRDDIIIKEILFLLLAIVFAFINKIYIVVKNVFIILKGICIGSFRIIITRSTDKLNYYGLFLVIFYSFLFSIILDRFVLKSIVKMAGIFRFDVIYRYFEFTNTFSLERIYFFFVFFFIIGFIIYLGMRKAIRYRYLIALLFLILIVCGKFTGSSLGFYDGMLLNNTSKYEQSTILGIPQGIRGDEWATEKPYYFAQVMGINKLEYFNKKLSFDGNDMVVSAFAPVKDIVVIARPDLWGFLFLPKEYAFSFYWFSRLVLLFMASFEMGLLLTRHYRYGLLAAFIITFASPVQWWLSQALMLMLMSGQFALVLFNQYLNAKKWYIKIITIMGVGLCGLIYILTMYPATQVPLGYIFMAILIYLLVKNKDKKPFALKKIVHYLIASIPFLLVLFHFYLNSKSAIDTITNTIYPGSGRPWIKLPWDYDLYQFVNAFMATIGQPNFLNASEISQFYTFLPFTMIICFTVIYKYRSKMLLQISLLCACTGLMLVSWLPQNSVFNRLSLFSYTYPVRITYAYGFGITILIISLLPLLEKRVISTSFKKTAGIISGGIGFITICVLSNSENIFNYFKNFKFGTILMILIVALMSYMGYLLLKGGRREIRRFSALFIFLSFFTTLMVNPVTHGLDSMFEKTTMSKIREINNENEGRWMVSGSPTISNLVTAQGVARTTGTYYYPDWTMMNEIDKRNQFIDLWNQFAHIDMRLTAGELNVTIFDHEKSEKVNGTNRIIYIPIETAKALNIKYIFTMVPIPHSIIEKGQVTLLYKDRIDPWSIYRVN
ncbi:hypothetical protein H6F38_09160 [Paenibacillus sp. EKM208P]|nr:hypothetical protein H6F38_09160 [Paenibacillus sp. EKM208P]